VIVISTAASAPRAAGQRSLSRRPPPATRLSTSAPAASSAAESGRKEWVPRISARQAPTWTTTEVHASAGSLFREATESVTARKATAAMAASLAATIPKRAVVSQMSG
jgi:hypothetical protein